MADGEQSFFACVGDTFLTGRETVLPYGATQVVAGTSCTSTREGVVCRVGDRGLRLSRAQYELF